MSWLGERRPVLAVDLETSGLHLGKDYPRLGQVGDGRRGWAFSYRDWRGVVREVVETYDRPVVGHNIKFDAGMLQQDGIHLPWTRVHDTLPMCFLVDSMGPKRLKDAAALYVDHRAKTSQEELDRAMAKNRWTWATVPTEAPPYWMYGAVDTVLTALLAETLWPTVQKYRAAYDIEVACERVLLGMELRGAMIDVEYCQRQYDALSAQLSQLLQQLDFNPNAPAQVAEALLAEGASLTKKTDKGNISITDDVLQELSPTSSLASKIIEARSLQKIISSYFENFLEMNVGGVLHPKIHPLAARTGRMSVTDPALQTIPRGTLVRDAFTPRPGNKLILIDYDNEELRVAAHVSADPAMLAAFDEGRDLHGELAERLYGPGYSRDQRGIGKTARFAKLYGAGVPKFMQSVPGLSRSEAEQIFAAIAAQNPEVEKTAAAISRAVVERDDGSGFGWVQLSDGRHIKVRSDKAYVGLNARVQGECAVVMKQALIDLDAAGLGEFLILPIHDEVMLDVPEGLVPEVRRVAVETMTRSDYKTPLTCAATVVDRWGDKYREEAA